MPGPDNTKEVLIRRLNSSSQPIMFSRSLWTCSFTCPPSNHINTSSVVMLILCCLELKANANLLIYLWGGLQGMMGAGAVMTWSTFPSLLGRWVCPQAIHPSFGVMRKAGAARQRDGSKERVMMPMFSGHRHTHPVPGTNYTAINKQG